MQTLQIVVRANGVDGPNAVIRMIHHFVALALFSAPLDCRETLWNLKGACMVALGGEELPEVHKPEVPAYRKSLDQWDPAGLRCNLEACRRVGMRHGAFKSSSLKEWLDYTIQTFERVEGRVA